MVGQIVFWFAKSYFGSQNRISIREIDIRQVKFGSPSKIHQFIFSSNCHKTTLIPIQLLESGYCISLDKGPSLKTSNENSNFITRLIYNDLNTFAAQRFQEWNSLFDKSF